MASEQNSADNPNDRRAVRLFPENEVGHGLSPAVQKAPRSSTCPSGLPSCERVKCGASEAAVWEQVPSKRTRLHSRSSPFMGFSAVLWFPGYGPRSMYF